MRTASTRLAECRGAVAVTAWAVVLWLWLPADAGNAQPVEPEASHPTRYRLDVDGAFTAYRVRTPATPASFVRRRLVQNVALDVLRPLGEEQRGEFGATLDVRFEQDFGRTCLRDGDCLRDSDPRARRDYQALVDDGRVEVRAAHANWGFRGERLRLRVRLGRQITWDATGMVRFDGVAVQARSGRFVATAFAGQRVQAASFAGSEGLSAQGIARLELPDELAPGAAPHVGPPGRAWVTGATLRGGTQALSMRGAFRESQDVHGSLSRRLALGATAMPHETLRIDGDTVFDLLEGRVMDASLMLAVDPNRLVHLDARAERHRPRFDPGTIWGFFDVVPVDRASAGVRVRVGRTTAELRGEGRRADLDEDGTELDGGLALSLRSTIEITRVGISGRWSRGDLGPIRSLTMDAARALGPWAEVSVWASVWYLDDALRAGVSGVSWNGGVMASTRVTEIARLQIRAEHSYSRYVGNRFRLTAALTLRVHR